MSSSAVLEQFRSSGRDLFLAGVISSHGGNLSLRQGDRILITRRGSMLARLEERDLIATGLEENDADVMLASTEIGVHRATYQGTSAQAIVHAHPPCAIARSLVCDLSGDVARLPRRPAPGRIPRFAGAALPSSRSLRRTC